MITPLDVPGETAESGTVRLAVGAPTGTRVPSIGLGCDRDGHVPDEDERAALAALAPRHLRVEVRLDRDAWRETLGCPESAAAIGAALEVSLHLLEEHAGALGEVAGALAAGLRRPGAGRSTPTPARRRRPRQREPGWWTSFARRCPASCRTRRSLGGTESTSPSSTATRPAVERWDGVCYSISPQIHAFTDTDVMENLDAQAETVRSARAIAGEGQVAVSPITLRRRVNFPRRR